MKNNYDFFLKSPFVFVTTEGTQVYLEQVLETTLIGTYRS